MHLWNEIGVLDLSVEGKEVILKRKEVMHGGGTHKDDILSMMLKYEEENPNYSIEEQIDDFLTFFIAGKNILYLFNVWFQ